MSYNKLKNVNLKFELLKNKPCIYGGMAFWLFSNQNDIESSEILRQTNKKNLISKSPP